MSITTISPQALSALKEQREQLWSSIDAILEENEHPRAELAARPVAVEVPELRQGDVTRLVEQSKRERFPEIALARLMYQFIATGIKTVDPSRILKDGETRGEYSALYEFYEAAISAMDDLKLQITYRLAKAIERVDIVRSGEAEGRKG